MHPYIPNPYSGTTLFSFVGVFFKRLFLFLRGDLSLQTLATDEIQILVLIGVALSGALVGTLLVLRKQTMLANALSHTLLLGIVVTFLFVRSLGINNPTSLLSLPALMCASLFSGLLTTFLTEGFTRFLKLNEDASIGLVFSTLFALGIVLVTLYTRNVHLGTELVMGNVDALVRRDIAVVFLAFLGNAFLFVLFFKEFLLTTFDPGLARSFGFSLFFFNALLMMQTSITAVAAFRAVGVLMVLAFFVAPPLTARLWTSSLKKLIFLSMGVGTLSAFLGVALSRHFYTVTHVGLSTGGLVVILLSLFYLITALLSPSKGFIFQIIFRRKKKNLLIDI